VDAKKKKGGGKMCAKKKKREVFLRDGRGKKGIDHDTFNGQKLTLLRAAAQGGRDTGIPLRLRKSEKGGGQEK